MNAQAVETHLLCDTTNAALGYDALQLSAKLGENVVGHAKGCATLKPVVCPNEKNVALHRPNEN